MQLVEDFMRDYFRSRTEIYRTSSAAFVPHLERFYAAEYKPFNPQLLVSISESESVEAVSTSDGVTEVITFESAGRSGSKRNRYRLIQSGESWRISSFEVGCFLCNGSGKSKDGQKACKFCKGKGWTLLEAD